jgi:NADH-quinone oxidoreductase subunit N
VTPVELLSVAPVGLFLLGAILALFFEAAGTPIAARKRGARTHVALLALATCGAVLVQVAVSWSEAATPVASLGGAFAFDRLSLVGTGLVAIVLAAMVGASVPSLRENEAEYGDVYALLLLCGAALSAASAARDWLALAAATTLAVVAFAPLFALDRRAARGAEASVKLVKWSGFLFALLAFGAALRFGATGDTLICAAGGEERPALALAASSLLLIFVLGWLAVVPLHMVRVDTVHGAPPFAGGLLAAGGMIVGVVWLERWLGCGDGLARLDDDLWGLLQVTALLSLVVPGVAALDQSRVGRVVAYLVAGQSGILLVALLAADVPGGRDLGAALHALVSAAVASSAAVVALRFLERSGDEGGSWEDWSGAGRAHPLFATSLLWLWASLAGVPGTAGFAARLVVGQSAFAAGLDALGVAVVVAPVLAAAPVLRLALFLFAREPNPGLRFERSGWRAVVIGIAGTAVLALGLLPSPIMQLAALLGR